MQPPALLIQLQRSNARIGYSVAVAASLSPLAAASEDESALDDFEDVFAAFTTVVLLKSSESPSHLVSITSTVPPFTTFCRALVTAVCSSVLLDETPTQ